jgi:hypothetical protein
MLQIGEEVVVMSAPGRFKVVAIDGLLLTIENAQGVRKTVLEQNVRRLDKHSGT